MAYPHWCHCQQTSLYHSKQGNPVLNHLKLLVHTTLYQSVLVLFLYTAKNVTDPWKEPMICLWIIFSLVHTQMKTVLSEYLSVTGTCESSLDSHHCDYSFHLHFHWSGKISVEGRINFCSLLLKILLYYINHLWTNTIAIVAMLLPSRETHQEMCLFQGHLCLLIRTGRNFPSSQHLLTNISLHTSWFCLQWGMQDICDLKLNEKLLKSSMSSWCSSTCLNMCTFVWRRWEWWVVLITSFLITSH